jgi:hypothetical protein
MRKAICIVTIGIASLSTSLTAAAAETVNYKGMGTYTVVRALLPLANGGAALHVVHDTTATIEPSESGFMEGECAGLGYLSPEGETTVKAICTFELNATDGFVINIESDPKAGSGSVQVMGGRGKFEKATGTGTISRRSLEGDKGSYTYEFAISTQ